MRIGVYKERLARSPRLLLLLSPNLPRGHRLIQGGAGKVRIPRAVILQSSGPSGHISYQLRADSKPYRAAPMQ